MDPLERMALDLRQKALGVDVQRHVQSALTQLEAYTELLEQGYFLGGTAVSILVAGHLHLTEKATRVLADDWLREQLGGLAAILSDGSTQAVRIAMSVKPKA
jgi:hypothetical protein